MPSPRFASLALALLALAPLPSTAGHGLPRRLAEPANRAAQAGNYQNWRHTPLTQIDLGNVARLQLAWQFPTGGERGHEGGPLVAGDTLYIHTPYPNRVTAINLADRSVKWRYEPHQDEAALSPLCCGTVSRGLAYGDGLILLQQTDTTLVALDAATGRERWRVKNGDPARGETATNAPHVFDHYVVTGIAGGEYGARGHITAYDLADGRRVWRGYSTGPDADLLIDPGRSLIWSDGRMVPVGKDSSLKTWQGDQWQYGGGTTWGWYAYDPALRLLYYGTLDGHLKALDVATGKELWVSTALPPGAASQKAKAVSQPQ